MIRTQYQKQTRLTFTEPQRVAACIDCEGIDAVEITMAGAVRCDGGPGNMGSVVVPKTGDCHGLVQISRNGNLWTVLWVVDNNTDPATIVVESRDQSGGVLSRSGPVASPWSMTTISAGQDFGTACDGEKAVDYANAVLSTRVVASIGCQGPPTPSLAVPKGLRWLEADSNIPITWCVDWTNAPAMFSQEEMLTEIRRAFNTWASWCDVEIQEVSLAGDCDMRIGFDYIDGPGNVLGFVFHPSSGSSMGSCGPTCGDFTLEVTGAWTIEDFFNVFLHEAGHALGLYHTDHPSVDVQIGDNVMDPYYILGTAPMHLGQEDIAQVVARYPHGTI